jgi:diguanylate cyclase (GGDEF)-like protein/PAS domain S-box-containing protein
MIIELAVRLIWDCLISISVKGRVAEKMDYERCKKKELIERIKELEILNHELLSEKDQEVRIDYPWTGNLGHWYWNIKTNTVTFNPLKTIALGYTESELPKNVSYQFFTEKLHPEDHKRTMDAMLDHLYGKAPVYEVEYRIKAKNGDYKWYYDRGKITQYDENGKPLFLAGIVFDVTKIREQQTELERKNKILEDLASMDGLTHISNHKSLMEYLELQIKQMGHSTENLSIVMFDIDDFKRVNDNHGHVIGDRILTELASILNKNIRGADLVGRYGGEEFLIILPRADIKEAISISERIRKTVESNLFFDDVRITISGGIKQFEGESMTDLIDAADKRLYLAKRNGKNQIVTTLE